MISQNIQGANNVCFYVVIFCCCCLCYCQCLLFLSFCHVVGLVVNLSLFLASIVLGVEIVCVS